MIRCLLNSLRSNVFAGAFLQADWIVPLPTTALSELVFLLLVCCTVALERVERGEKSGRERGRGVSPKGFKQTRPVMLLFWDGVTL